ncbi:MAG: hypothetical protein QNL04_04525, partial [SAR324 cluster bacterium]|nr:hypothetical protein [SAR324 cluster bacterium]
YWQDKIFKLGAGVGAFRSSPEKGALISRLALKKLQVYFAAVPEKQHSKSAFCKFNFKRKTSLISTHFLCLIFCHCTE